MTIDPASLERLHDIVVAPPVPWWPPAPGWLWLLGIASAAGLLMLLRGVIRWQRNRYRREALAELARLEAAARDPAGRSSALAGMAALLKRTALTAYGREPVAALTGPAWFAFLDRTGGTSFAAGLGAALEQAVYRTSAGGTEAATPAELAAGIRNWIRAHEALPESAQESAAPSGVESATAPVEKEAA